MATTRRATGARRKEATARSRLTVTVLAPDGVLPATRGLATWLRAAAPRRARGEITVAVVSDARMRTLNRAYRGKDYATDVLSFPVGPADARSMSGPGDAYLGDIVIARGVAQRQSDEVPHPLRTELRVLALHGLLHLLGYDHTRDQGQMARVEARLRRHAGLRDGLIGRHLRAAGRKGVIARSTR